MFLSVKIRFFARRVTMLWIGGKVAIFFAGEESERDNQRQCSNNASMPVEDLELSLSCRRERGIFKPRSLCYRPCVYTLCRCGLLAYCEVGVWKCKKLRYDVERRGRRERGEHLWPGAVHAGSALSNGTSGVGVEKVLQPAVFTTVRTLPLRCCQQKSSVLKCISLVLRSPSRPS